MSKKLSSALIIQRKKSEPFRKTLYGTLGIPLAGQRQVQVLNRQGYVYVRLNDNENEVIQAFNNTVAQSYDLPVIVVREGGRFTVKGVNTQRYENNWNNSSPYLPAHGTAHSFYPGGGGDVSWIYSRQIMHGLVYPNATGSTVDIASFPLYTSNGWVLAGATGTVNLLQYRPVSGSSALMLLIYADASNGNPGLLVNSGSYFDYGITGSVHPYIPRPNLATQIPLTAVRLSTGTLNIGWDNLYDVRQWIHSIPSGSSSSGGGGGSIDTLGFAGLYNGVPIGTGTFLNVRGDASFVRSGSMFDLNVWSPGADQIGVVGKYRGLLLGTGTYLDVTGGATLSLSGTNLNLNVPGFTGTHNTLSGLQGGLSGEYYHLSSGTFWNVEAGGGWKRSTGTYTFLRADAPVYEIYTNTNITGSISVGMRFRITHQAQDKNFIVHAVGITGSNTYLTLYGGTDYTLSAAALSQPLYSEAKWPFGFPSSPDKWTVTMTSSANASQANPSGSMWYNLGSLSITAPIGAWIPLVKTVGDATGPIASVATNQFVSLSTSPNTESNPEYTVGGASTIAAATENLRLSYLPPPFLYTATVKTVLYLISKSNTAMTSIAIRGDLFQTTVKLVDAYL